MEVRRLIALGKVEELAKLFNESMAKSKPKTKKMAIALMEDDDGDFAIVKVDGSGYVKVLGWITGEDNAQEFSQLLNLMTSGEATCRSGDDPEMGRILEENIDKLR